MKKEKSLLILFALAAITLVIANSCKESSRMMNKSYAVSPFSAIECDIVGNIVFTQASTVSVAAEGSEALMKNLDVSVENGELKLTLKRESVKKRLGFGSNHKLAVRVSAPSIAAIHLSGVGNLKLNGDVTADTLTIALDGVGNLTAENLECRHLSVESLGVGNISLKGSAESVNIHSEDVGNIDAREFLTDNAVIHSSGVGNIKCYASQSIDITGSSVGNITYYGRPDVKKINKSGIGNVKAGSD